MHPAIIIAVGLQRAALVKKDKTMAGVHDKEKHQIAVKFHHRVWRKIEKSAAEKGMTEGQYIRWVVSDSVDSMPLTAEDARIIAERIAKAEKEGRMK